MDVDRMCDSLSQELSQIYVSDSTGHHNVVHIDLSAPLSCKECSPETQVPITQEDELIAAVQSRYQWEYYFAQGAVQEYIRFLELKCSVQDWKCVLLSPSPVIERVWETHLRDTNVYRKYCKCIYKCQNNSAQRFRFLDHVPGMTKNLRTTKFAYHAKYGLAPDEMFWAEDAVALSLQPDVCEITCHCLAAEMFRKKGTPPHRARFVFEGVPLDASQSLGEWGVEAESTIALELCVSSD